MSTCFVIQPFDAGPYDKRYDDVIAPAIEAAGLQPYRVDRDPSASIPIEKIESGIRAASLCLADITEDNPNVWFELGYAISARTDVILICSAHRVKTFPFDVQHRNIVRYSTESSRDFEVLKQRISERIKALLSKQEKLSAFRASSPVANVAGLAQHEIVALVAIAQNLDTPSGSVSTYLIRQDMEKAGFTKVATTLALVSLLRNGLVHSVVERNYDGEDYTAYVLDDSGMEWLLKNQDRFVLRQTECDEATTQKDRIPF
ncbi:MAG: hypothetical protein FJ279_13160 [Planctomycetes bacterium]|nr:hypothetical protein [Planctomycetota bacterium]